MELRGRRATVFGLGHFGGGVAVARWLAQQGATVTITDQANAAALADSLGCLNDVPIAATHLGGHREEDFVGADLVVVNPAVRPDSPWLEMARAAGAAIRTEFELFCEHCPAEILGVTGSNGKSTTAAMIAAILRCEGRRVFLGGNIGRSLLQDLEQIRAGDWAVLEISSFQLWHSSPAARMPHVAVVTNCTPNHLDWHPDFGHYVSAKQRILAGRTERDVAVLNPWDREVGGWSGQMGRPGFDVGEGAGLAGETGNRAGHGSCGVRRLAAVLPLEALPPLRVLGEHNRIDAACAASAAMAAGCRMAAVEKGLREYGSLPQRLECVGVMDGRSFYNDSTATTPESTIAALRALPMRVWLMAGGKNKGFDFGPLAQEIVDRAAGAAFFGACRESLREEVLQKSPHFACVSVEMLGEALAWCRECAQAGDAVVLSPGCASTDQFRNFRERGERFVELLTNERTML